MLIVAIILLAVIVMALLFRPKRSAPAAALDHRRDDGIIFGETPGDLRMSGPLPGDMSAEDFTPGDGDFGGGGSSDSWDAGDSGD
jgi:uncharacterized membrane protein YgcG